MSRKTTIITAAIIVAAAIGYFFVWLPLVDLSRWNPHLAVGLPLVVVSAVLAFVAHYYLVVRKTTSGGVVEVNGLLGYISFKLLTGFVLPLVLGIPCLVGGFLTLFGLVKLLR